MSTTTTTTTTEPPAGSTVIQFSAETEAAALSAAKEGAQVGRWKGRERESLHVPSWQEAWST